MPITARTIINFNGGTAVISTSANNVTAADYLVVADHASR
jgi:hypothetical protein